MDGVLTNPEEKRVTQPEIFEEIIKRIEKEEPVGLNTGRSLHFIISQILEPLEAKVKDKRLLKNIFAVGEMGARWITYDDNGIKTINMNQTISVPQKIQDEIRVLVKTSYWETMFYDETKQTMVSIEQKPGTVNSEFLKSQQNLILDLQTLLVKHNLDHDLRIDSTRISTDVENTHVGKALGARKFIELLSERGIDPEEYIGFGDSASDYEMFEELNRLGKKSRFVFVGGKEILTGKENLDLITFTEQLVDKGTSEYLQSN